MSTAASVQIRTAGSAGYHLNRRGRFLLVGFPVLVLVVLAAAAAAFFGINGMAPAAASEEGPSRSVDSVTVGYGDTLWDIAGRSAPDASRNETILRIGELNSLNGADLQPGQVLFVPTNG
ncbi:LysM peptidoglycan-binding domain-containing protein [Citricoccus nitrophenolicus]|uniref:LysM peptidoglycan-binding domain-containing protein n=1 Tax=Citricoccus nitrophenolicus TaxID=863575 RepID=UPI0031EC887C